MGRTLLLDYGELNETPFPLRTDEAHSLHFCEQASYNLRCGKEQKYFLFSYQHFFSSPTHLLRGSTFKSPGLLMSTAGKSQAPQLTPFLNCTIDIYLHIHSSLVLSCCTMLFVGGDIPKSQAL